MVETILEDLNLLLVLLLILSLLLSGLQESLLLLSSSFGLVLLQEVEESLGWKIFISLYFGSFPRFFGIG